MTTALEHSPVHMLHRAIQLTTSIFEEVLGKSNLTHSQMLVLLAISQNHGTSQTLISAGTGIDRSTLADVTHRLVRKGYVRRQRAQTDARRYCLNLTKSGAEVLASALPLLREVDRRVLASLRDAEAAEFMRLLSTAVGRMETSAAA